jgi:hypothetical protein
MLDRLAFYLDLVISQCLPSASGALPGASCWVLVLVGV